MADLRDKLKALFDLANRYNNFGEVLMRMTVRGFRCHSTTTVEVGNPITAFCGLNGTGKSTLLQLAATSYQSPNPGSESYYIRDFLIVSTLDPNPFTNDASVEFKYWQEDRTLRTVTLSRSAATQRWQGYPRRPKRVVFFAGIGFYLPRVEQRDFIIRNARRLAIAPATDVDQKIRECTSKVLGYGYDSMVSNTVTLSHRSGRTKTGKVISVTRTGTTYSEAHMGYGEGRSHYLISMLETLPERSLVLIEEPETSLHGSARHEFGRYLVDVSIRRRHQILLTTHSESLLRALPSESRVFISKTDQGVDLIVGLTAGQAKSLMAQGEVKALHVFVEDTCAKAIIIEIIRRSDSDFLSTIGVYPVGDSNAVANVTRSLQETPLKVAAVRDGDSPAVPKENLFKLPGTRAPEYELFDSEAIKDYLRKQYGIELADFAAGLVGVDHHEWIERLSRRVAQQTDALLAEIARVYVSGLPENVTSSLTEQLKDAAGRA
jgi:predicted ATPase